MDPQAVADRLDELQLVDGRDGSEWQAGHIDAAVNVPEEGLPDRVDELDRARPAVTVCRAGTRRAEVAERMRGPGFDARSLDGGSGMLAWKWAGVAISGTKWARADAARPVTSSP